MRAISLFFMLLLISQVSAEIYKWVDAQGNVHYSDEPLGPGSKRMRQLPGLSTYSPPPLPSRSPQEEPGAEMGRDEPEAVAPPGHPGYQVLKIVSPEHESTVRSSPGEVPVFVALSPVLREGDYFRVVLDGRMLAQHYFSTVIRLNNVDRGEHRVAVAVFSKDGRKLLESEAHTFYLHRTIAGKRPAPRGN